MSTHIDSVLVANRGEIARRVFRTARDMGLRTTAIHVDADADAPFVREADGMIKKGSQMINAVTNSEVPHLTVIIGSSYGAGTYGMSGRAFGNRFTVLWPTAKIAVMGPKQIAGVMSLVRRGQAARQGIEFDEDEDAKLVAAAEEIQERNSLALYASGAVTDDSIIDPRDTRTVLAICLSACRTVPVEGAEGYGVFRL